MELIRLADIHFAYPGGRPVLKGVDFALAEGERVGILGPNGAGKSTLFQVAMGLLPPASGEVAFLGEPCRGEGDFRRLRRAVGYVFQDPDDMLFCPTVLEEVAFGLLNLGKSREAARDLARATLARLDLARLARRVTHQLSGGEKRLVSLAAVLAMAPRGILLDEPGNGLDPAHLARLDEVLANCGAAWAMVSHDAAYLAARCQRLCRLEAGRLLPA